MVETIGLKEANRALKKLPQFAKEHAQPVFDITAFHIMRRAQDLVAVETGQTQRAITWQARPRSLSAVVGISDRTAIQWKFLEYGTVKMTARPFLRPAAEQFAADHQSRLAQALQQSLTQLEREAKA